AVAGDFLTIDSGRLDLDHISAPVSEMAHCSGSSAGVREIQYRQSVQRQPRLGLGQHGFVSRALRHPSSPLGLAAILRRNRQSLKRTAMNAVDLALVFAVDGSASVTYEEFGLIAGGMAAALREPPIIAGLLGGPAKASMCSLLLWSGTGA